MGGGRGGDLCSEFLDVVHETNVRT
jgi:hypothetical protein